MKLVQRFFVLFVVMLAACDFDPPSMNADFTDEDMEAAIEEYIASGEADSFFALCEQIEEIKKGEYLSSVDTIVSIDEKLCFFGCGDSVNAIFVFDDKQSNLFHNYRLFTFEDEEIKNTLEEFETGEIVNGYYDPAANQDLWDKQQKNIAENEHCNYLFLMRLKNGSTSLEIGGNFFSAGDINGSIEIYDLRNNTLMNKLSLSVSNSELIRFSDEGSYGGFDEASFDNLIENLNREIGTMILKEYTVFNEEYLPYLKYERLIGY